MEGVPSTNQEDNLTAEDRYQIQLETAADKYDLVIDIHSLRKLAFGWGLYGRKVNQFAVEKKGEVQGRVVTVVGEYNTGKTWLIKMLLKNDLDDSQALHTPGICMTFVEPEKKEDSKDQVQRSSPARRGIRRGGIGGVRSPIRKNASVVASSVPKFDYVILDSAGTEEACAHHNLKDVRATQIFIRKILVEVADKLIFVTSKFNQSSQIAINAIIKQLGNKAGCEITPTNRLIVVHNMMEVDSKEVLERKIAELANVYLEPEELDPELEEEIERAKGLHMRVDRDVAPWQVVEELVTVGAESYRFTYFNTRLTTHILLVKHSEEGWRHTHNMAGLEVIRTMIRYKLDLRRINLLDSVMDIAQRELQKYLVGFDASTNKLKIENHDDVPYIVPEHAPVYQKDDWVYEDEEGQTTTQEATEGDLGEEPMPFRLKDMQFTDNDIIPEGDKYLHGSVYESNTQFVLKIVMPGVVSKDSVQVSTSDFMHVRIRVRIPAPFPDVPTDSESEITCLASDVQWGQSHFKWTAPPGKNFYNLKKVEVEAASELSNGIYTLYLQKPEDEEDGGEKEDNAGQ